MPASLNVLVTSGTGHIGSQTRVEQTGSGRDVFIINNLSNSKTSISNWGLRDIKDGD